MRSGGCTIHRQRRVSVAGHQIPENLVVRSILLQDVDHVPDWIMASREFDLLRSVVDQTVVLDLSREGRKMTGYFGERKPLDRPTDQRGDIRMRVRVQSTLH